MTFLAILLSHIRAVAGIPERAQLIITVPAHFSIPSKQVVLEAANLAGIKVRLLVDEPIAASLSYVLEGSITNLDTMLSANKTMYLIVSDIGGGTSDISLMRLVLGSDDQLTIEPVMRAGNKYLAGVMITVRMAMAMWTSMLATGAVTPQQAESILGTSRQT